MNQDLNSVTDPYFMALVFNFQTSAMIGMGKIMNPFQNKITRNMAEAKQSIDMLDMLERKTRGNLSEDEKRMLQKILTELRLNYVDEAKKDEEAEAKAEEEKTEEKDKEKKETIEEEKEEIKSEVKKETKKETKKNKSNKKKTSKVKKESSKKNKKSNGGD